MCLSPKEQAALQLMSEGPVYENYFFNRVKDIKWFYPLKKKGYFSPEKAPEPRPASTEGYFSIPSWNVLPYLERISEAYKDYNENYIDELLAIIKDVTDYHVEHGRKLDNYRTWSSFVKILLNLPLDKISIETVGFIKEWLTSKFGNASVASDVALKLLPKLLDSSDSEDWEKAEKIVEIITEIKWIPLSKEIMNISEKKEEAETLVERYILLKSFKKNAVKIGEKCGMEVISKLANKLKKVLKRDGKDTANDYSYIWIRSLFNISNHSIYDTKATLTVILKDVLLAKANYHREEAEEILNAFLSDTYPYPIFKRVALFVIGSEWDQYKDFFWEIIDSKKIEWLFEDSNYKPEMYVLLKNNVTNFLLDEKERIKSIIAKGPSKYLPETEKGKYVAYWKQEWYSALKADAYFLALYNAEHEITGTEVAPMFLKEPEVRWVGSGGSPLSEDEILAMTNIRLAEYLKTFKASGDLDAPTVRGLAELLKVVVKEEPKKIIADLTPFMDVGFIYLHEILSGIKEARDENKYIEWEPLLNFIMNYMDRDDFWEDKFIVDEPYETFYSTGHQCIVQIVAELILIGVEDTVWSMSEEGFLKAEDIIFLILKRFDVEKLDRKTTDLIALSLWTPLARTLIAMIFLAINIDKTRKKNEHAGEVRWPHKFRKKYDEMLKNNYIESFTVFGEYLPTLLYLDKSWVQNKIASFEKRMGEKQIEVFVGSYLYRGKVHKDIYDFLKPFYLYYIEHPLSERHAEELLIQQICVGYLQGWEDIEKDESLFRKILDQWNVEQVLEIINYFWILRKPAEQSTEEYERTRKKIREFWEWMYKSKFERKKVKELNDSDKRILSKLTLLTVFLNNISTEAYQWLALSAPYVDVEHNSSFFIEYLDKFKEDDKKSMEYVGRIFLEMLKVFTPNFSEEEILSIVGKLYKAGQKENANKICNHFGAHNNDFLKNIYIENQK